MDLSIVIVSWNVSDKLKENLEALFKSETEYSFEVFVVDNNSSDDSVEMVNKFYPQVNLINNSENLGFAKANNQAIKKSHGDYILLLNPDMKVFSDTIDSALSWMVNNQQATVSGCKLVNSKNEVIKQVRNFPKLFDQLMITLKLAHIFPQLVNKYLCKNFNYNQEAKVDTIRGAFFLINKDNYIKISGKDLPLLDERYFIWFEEVDFCKSVYKLGGEVWYNPGARCLDYVGASFSQVKRGITQKYFRDSMLKYFKKWENKSSYFILKYSWKLIMLFIY